MSACLQSVLHSVARDECFPMAMPPATAPVARPSPPATMPTQPVGVCQLPWPDVAPRSGSGPPAPGTRPPAVGAAAGTGGGAAACVIVSVVFAAPPSATVKDASAGVHPLAVAFTTCGPGSTGRFTPSAAIGRG